MSVMDTVRNGRSAEDFDARISALLERPVPKHFPRIVCADGFSLSVQAGELLYSIPREDHGPWIAVEVGYPTERPEPWAEWEPYCEDPGSPTSTVYARVPVELVEALIAAHGGDQP